MEEWARETEPVEKESRLGIWVLIILIFMGLVGAISYFLIYNEQIVEKKSNLDEEDKIEILVNNGDGIEILVNDEDKIEILVIEFEGKDQDNHGEICCNDANEDCWFTYGRESCNQDETSYSFVDLLNNENKYIDISLNEKRSLKFHSLFYLNDFLEREAGRYGRSYSQDPFEITILGPYKLDKDPPKRDRADSSEKIVNFFNEEFKQREINTNTYDEVVVIFLHDYHDTSLYPGFVSFASFPNLYISMISQVYDDDSALGVFIHENIHNLGKFTKDSSIKDKYIAPCPRGPYMSCSIIPEGIPEPNKKPLFPQNKACIMSQSIELAEDGEGKAWNNFDEVIICPETAKELGWKN